MKLRHTVSHVVSVRSLYSPNGNTAETLANIIRNQKASNPFEFIAVLTSLHLIVKYAPGHMTGGKDALLLKNLFSP